MFINTIEFPLILDSNEQVFLEWFKWTNSIYKNFDGFISRRLLKNTKGGQNYISLVEHESEKTFMAMHTSKERKEAYNKLQPLLEGKLFPQFYEVIIDT